jgi:nicotinate-nucleotide adenylyltransferase
MMRNWPLAFRGQKIGLLGGSFDPAHLGHLHVAETAACLLGLDKVWWLVSPQNPLKKSSSPLKQRLLSAKEVARGPKMVVTSIETDLKTQYTFDTLTELKQRYIGVKFIWIMGGDNLAGFEHWKGWTKIVSSVPICIVSRPSAGPKARLGRMARHFEKSRLSLAKAPSLANRKPPIWVYIPARYNQLSSTAIRANRRKA